MQRLPMRRVITLLASSALLIPGLLGLTATTALAAAPPAPYFNGFENASDVDYATYPNAAMYGVTRVPSGTGSIPSATGSWHAAAGADAGSFTRYGGYSSAFPTGGYTTSVDIYLNMSTADAIGTDLRFDWSSAISDTTAAAPGDHRRDFIFNVGTDPTTAGQFIVSASNNAPGNPAGGIDPLTVATTGWYTFQHTFRNNAGVLAVDMKVLNSSGTELASWTRSDPTDIIGVTVGGNRYGWLVDSDFPLALDNVTRSGVNACVATGFNGLTAAQNGGIVTGDLDATGCDIGAYNPTSVSGAVIHDALYYGVVANGISLNVSDSTIRDIGDSPVLSSGNQRGIGIYYTAASGTISGNHIYDYQKGGIVAKNGGSVLITGNTVTGAGPTALIAQNGIQISSGTSVKLVGNTVSGNTYTPKAWVACGVLYYQAGGVKASGNTIFDNERNVCNFGKGGGQFNLTP